jgi:hypothetical protein
MFKMDVNNLYIIATIGENDASIAIPHSEEALVFLSKIKILYRTSNWRGISEFEHTDKKMYLSLVDYESIKQLPTPVPPEDKI